VLRAVHVKRFKSLEDTERVELAPLTVLFGPNAAGKSNFLDAIQVLSRLASERTVADALGPPVRGLPLETFTLPGEGLAGLLAREEATFSIESDLETAEALLRYRAEIEIRPASGALSVRDEFLATLGRKGEPKGHPAIERVGDRLRIRRKSKPAHPREEPLGLNHTLLSDRRLSGVEYRAVERARDEMRSWRTYYLDPRVAMRAQQAPQDVQDIGPLGEHIASFLYRLRGEDPRRFDAVRRTLKTLIPAVEDLAVDLDTKRGVLDIELRQNGTPFSSRVVSEGTLRVLALVCVALNPWSGSVVAFEEPENGVHPRRIELIARLLAEMSTTPTPRQVIVTTHSPIFCASVIRRAREDPERVALYRVLRDDRQTRIVRFDTAGPLFDNSEIAAGLAAAEDVVFEGLALRGMLDG
jgi:predicted ATPase